jgi:ankyrin repeat protein
MAKVLLEAGADVNAKNAAGWTPFHFAALYDHPDTASLLKAHGAKETNKRGR